MPAGNLWCWVSLQNVLIVASLLTITPVRGDGVCTKHEVVSKTRQTRVIETYRERYRDRSRSCYYYDDCPYHTSSRWVDKQEEYTDLETKEVCCTGYKEREHKHCYSSNCKLQCDPVCDFTCFHGKCSVPNKCLCDSGYSMQNGTSNICEPVCSEPCVNGFCSAPEYCSCNTGYEAESSDKYSCRPVCTPVCDNAKCTSPNTCTCYPGYKKVTEDPHKCHAHCSTPCLNAVCTKPEECSCLLGYQKKHKNSNLCDPVCSEDCENGTCTGPDECTCFAGYTSVGNYTCEPVCTNCLNSFCSAPELCVCFPGYETDVRDKSVCSPVCSPHCSSSNCTAPDTCECFPGFEETENPAVCKPYCSDGCENGVCTEPENCTCLWGFQSESDSSNCSLTNESHYCTFVNELAAYDDDKSCFTVKGDLSLEGLKDCKILQELLRRVMQDNINGSLVNLTCGGVSSLRKIGSNLILDLFCDVSMTDGEPEVMHESELTLSSTAESDVTDDYSSSVSSYSSTETNLLITTSYENEERSEESIRESFAATQKKDTTLNGSELPNNEEPTQENFKIIVDKNVTDSYRIKFSDFLISLNITAQFLPMIRWGHLTRNSFHHSNTSLDGDWCLCHRNNTWKLCAAKQTQLFLCPCTPSSSSIVSQLKESTTSMSTLMILVLSLMFVFLLVLGVLHVFNGLRQLGNYSTSTKEMAEFSTEFILPADSSEDVCTSSQEIR